MTIFHGGYMAVETPEIILGKFAKDFGAGFYCTELQEQAIRWAKRYDTPVVNEYNYLPDNNLRICNFSEMNETWLDFIVDCRSGKAHDFDIVSGPMANDQIYNYISDFISGIINREQFWILAKFKHPTHQICFCNRKSLKCITFKKSTEYGR